MLTAASVTKTVLPLLLCLQPGDANSVDRLVQKLASPHFREREAATRQLLKMWPDAIPALKKALKSSDAEVAKRAVVILEKFRRRPLERLRRFIKEGKLDLAVELMARWPKGKYEAACWQEARKLCVKLSKQHAKQHRNIGVLLAKDTRKPPLVLSTKRFTKDVKTRERLLFARVREVNVGEAAFPACGSIIFSSGKVRLNWPTYQDSAVFAGVSVAKLYSACNMIIVSDGGVALDHPINCVVIARGSVTCRWPRDSVLVSSKRVDCPAKEATNCKILEHQTTPLGWIHFFDPAEEGITVAKAKTGVAVAKLAAKKRFATAGLRKGDILTKVDTDAVTSPETFRRLLRRHVAWEEEMTFHVRRGGKKLQVRIPRRE